MVEEHRGISSSFSRQCLRSECVLCALTSSNQRSDGVSLDCSHQRQCFLLWPSLCRWREKQQQQNKKTPMQKKTKKRCRECLMSLHRERMSLKAEVLCAMSSRSRQESVPLSYGNIATEPCLPAQSFREVSRSLRVHFEGTNRHV